MNLNWSFCSNRVWINKIDTTHTIHWCDVWRLDMNILAEAVLFFCGQKLPTLLTRRLSYFSSKVPSQATLIDCIVALQSNLLYKYNTV